jgi:hypothetical protein
VREQRRGKKNRDRGESERLEKRGKKEERG